MLPTLLTVELPEANQSFNLVYVPGGEFVMGDDESEFEDERPVHRVRLSAYYLGQYPVTQALWRAVRGYNPSHFVQDDRPVENVSWDSVQAFVEALAEMPRRYHSADGLPLGTAEQAALAGLSFRLPTEAEWEYAARGGPYSQGFTYAGSDKLSQVGWYKGNSEDETHPVGQLLPNELGLYDLSGNVLEWCADWHSGDYYRQCQTQGRVFNPKGPDQGEYRVLRGGGCFSRTVDCWTAYRFADEPGYRDHDVGCRLLLPLQSMEGPEAFP